MHSSGTWTFSNDIVEACEEALKSLREQDVLPATICGIKKTLKEKHAFVPDAVLAAFRGPRSNSIVELPKTVDGENISDSEVSQLEAEVGSVASNINSCFLKRELAANYSGKSVHSTSRDKLSVDIAR